MHLVFYRVFLSVNFSPSLFWDGNEEASSQDCSGVRGPLHAVLVPQPRSLHVPLIQLSADRLFAVTPHHHACGACVEFLQLLREPVCPVPAERELQKALQQPATVQTTQIPRAQHQLPPEHLCYPHDLHQEEYTCCRQRTWPKNRSLHLASVLQTEQNLSIRVAGDLQGSIEAFGNRVWAVFEAEELLL